MSKKKAGIIIFTLLFVSLVFSQTWGTIGVSTLGVWVTIPAGETITGTLTFTNFHEQETNLVIKICDWKQLKNGENLLMEANSSDKSLAPYIKVTPEKAPLSPGESRKFRYEITMPRGITGALWGAMLAVPERRVAGAGSNNSSGNEINLNELAKYGFTVKIWALEPSSTLPAGEILSLEAQKSEEGTKALYRFRVDFANRGNVPLRPEGTLNIFDAYEERIASYNVDRFGVLPGSNRVLSVPDSGVSLPDGKVKAEAVIKYGSNNITRKQIILHHEEE